MPKVSVLISVYNCERYIDEAVESICRQTYDDFELLVLDDASTDATWARMTALQKTDRRIRIYRNASNEGVADGTNRLVAASRGRYIACMDADDIALPERLEKQVAVLDSGKADLCGGWMIVFGDGPEFLRSARVEDEEIRAELLFSWPFCKPTVMLRRELAERNPMNSKMIPAADYDWGARIAVNARLYNIPEPLVRYRVHAGQISRRGYARQQAIAVQIATNQLRTMGIRCSEPERKTHASVVAYDPPSSLEQVKKAEAWLAKLSAHFAGKPAAQRVVSMRWYRHCLKAGGLGPRVFWIFAHSTLSRRSGFRRWQYMAVFVLSMLHIERGSKFYQILVSRSPASRVSK